ncbi:MAG: hypothetical protein AAB539_03750 [Patescibacteria group bacterium]
MGQYFKIVNEDKKEVVNAWDLGGAAKFWEWLYNPQASVLVWLLRKSDGDGGGDIPTDERERYQTLGRWAGDRIILIGDYDSSGLWDAAETRGADGKHKPHTAYTDISALVRKEFNAAIRRDRGGSNDQL